MAFPTDQSTVQDPMLAAVQARIQQTNQAAPTADDDPTGQHSFRTGIGLPPGTPDAQPGSAPSAPIDPMLAAVKSRMRETESDAPPSTPKPQGDAIDRMVAGTSLEPINRGLEQGVAEGFGLKTPDPNHPESLTFSDIGKQTWNNLKRTAERSYEKLGGATDEQLNKAPAYRLDVPLRSAAAMVGTPFDMAAQGIDGLARMVEDGANDIKEGIKGKPGLKNELIAASGAELQMDHERIARGFGKLLASVGQIAAGAEMPEATGKVGRALTEYAPREVKGDTLTGSPRLPNMMQGPINRSVGALARDVRFGDPSKALIEEGITWPGTKGRLAQVNGKLSQVGSQLRGYLQKAKGSIDVDNVLDPIIKKYKDRIRLAAESDDVKAQAYQDLDVLRKTAAEHAPSGKATATEANGLKQAIGDAVNWEQREKPMHNHVADAYREAYGQLKDQVNGMIGNAGAELNRRVSNLMAARNALKELNAQTKAGRSSGPGVTHPAAWAQEKVGHIAPAAIVDAQKAAKAVPPLAATGAYAVAGSEPRSEPRSEPQSKWEPESGDPVVTIQTSDGRKFHVHGHDLEKAKVRDPGLKVLDLHYAGGAPNPQ